MRAIFAALGAIIALAQPAIAAPAANPSFSDSVNALMQPVVDVINATIFAAIPMGWLVEGAPDIPVICVWLFGFGIFFTGYTGFINLRGFAQAIRIVSGRYDNPKDPGEVTHFQALTAALSGTVGLGNIAGVAVAVSIGGPGATFWMILVGLFGMTNKFVECTLGLKYRQIDDRGIVSGGPMYYLRDGLAGIGMPGLGKVMATLFALLCIGGAFGAGSMFQVNQSSAQFTAVAAELTGGEASIFAGRPWIFGSVFAVCVGLVIIGGIRQITRVTEFLVPIMAGIYVTACITILVTYASEIPSAIAEILAGALSPEGTVGGIIGVIVQGLRRGTFSNEAGVGSAPIAHSAAKTKEPVAEGLVGLLEPFIDTVVICTMTALVIIVTDSYQTAGGADGIALTSSAFDQVLTGFRYVLSVAVVMFAFSTSITWFYYGQRSFLFLVGDNPGADLAFKMAFLSSLVIGSAMQLTSVMDIADALLLGMGFPNLVGVFLLRKEIKGMLQDYLSRLKTGDIRPYSA